MYMSTLLAFTLAATLATATPIPRELGVAEPVYSDGRYTPKNDAVERQNEYKSMRKVTKGVRSTQAWKLAKRSVEASVPVAQVAVASPNEQKTRRDLESVLEELD